MNKIPTHKIAEVFDGNNAFLLHVSDGKIHSNTEYIDEEWRAQAGYAHRDDYYIFFLVKEGNGRIMIDFEEYEIGENAIHCIMPGQVHQPAGYINVSGWFLAIDSLYVKNEYRHIFEKNAFFKTLVKASHEEIDRLETCLAMLEQRISCNELPIERTILSELVSVYVGMVAEIYCKETPTLQNNRSTEIAMQFKSLLAESYRTMKYPKQYAQQMNLSLVYLNEVVKKTIGLSVSRCIQNEIVLQAKRLLYYTNLTVKDIALRLGYEDRAYFTRLFTKIAGCPPLQFRKENLD